jgi:hypothetical protein
MFIRYGFTATGSSGYGAVYLVGAHISGHLDCARRSTRSLLTVDSRWMG